MQIRSTGHKLFFNLIKRREKHRVTHHKINLYLYSAVFFALNCTKIISIRYINLKAITQLKFFFSIKVSQIFLSYEELRVFRIHKSQFLIRV
jgi:hypothetical protein